MRFLIRELAYERPVAAGRLRYEIDGRPTGAIEMWRLTDAVDGYRFLRVDLDAREAPSGDSYLYHLTIGADGRAERLAFRVWGLGRRLGGNVLLDERSVAVARNVDNVAQSRLEDEVTLAPGYAFWFPASTGLSLLAHLPAGEVTAVTLDYTESLKLHVLPAYLRRDQPARVEVAARQLLLQPLTISWNEQSRAIWLDEYGWPLKMERGDGLTAVTDYYIRY